MQSFLPYASYKDSARVLDRQRLGKQRIEARMIINILEGRSSGWSHHPAVKMWSGYADALKEYYNVICQEWEKRGYQHNMGYYDLPDTILYPWWLGNKEFHRSHQSKLFYKSPANYFGWTGIERLEYVWPKGEQHA